MSVLRAGHVNRPADSRTDVGLKNLRLVEDMERAETALRRCSALYVQLCKRLDQFPSFFSAPLFGALDAWGQHPSQDIPLAAIAQDDRFTIRYGRTYAACRTGNGPARSIRKTIPLC
jgi:hypothetical protein